MIVRCVFCLATTALYAVAGNDMICLPSAPSAHAGSSVILRAWYAAPGGAKAEFKWSVTAGALHKKNKDTIWDLKRVRPGVESAEVEAMVKGVKAAECSIELLVEAEQPRGKRDAPGIAPGPDSRVLLSGRTFLAPGQAEPEGYALYSYLLFAAPPASADRDRYIAVFDAALRLLRPVEELARTLRPSQLNAMWIPVQRAPAAEPDAKWFVDNYDYSAGAANLARAGIQGSAAGVYMVSVRAPLSRGNPTPPFLVQDLSHVPAPLASTWVALFINQAAQERFWNKNTIGELAAKMRLVIALAAEGVPEIQKAMATWISISK